MCNEEDNKSVKSDLFDKTVSDDSIQAPLKNKFFKATSKDSLTTENLDSLSMAVGEPIDAKPCRSFHWKLELTLLALMLLVALIGMAVTQASVNTAWEFWFVAIIFFGGIGTVRDLKWARQANLPVWGSIVKQILHWAVLLLALKALFWVERYNAITREAASISAILLLATTCVHAGVHFHWTFAIIGVVLTVMSIVVGVLKQSMLLSSLVILPIVLGGAFLILLKIRRNSREQS